MNDRFAAIDIGTNSILMLVAEKDIDGLLRVIKDEHRLARLGEGIAKSNVLKPEAIQRSADILSEYNTLLQNYKVDIIKAVGTSALRDAENKEYALHILSDALKHDIEIIDGELEAAYSFFGAVEDESDSLVIDIGGGSTEIINGNINRIENLISLQTGVVRITENFKDGLPASKSQLIEAENSINQLLNNISFPLNYNKVYAVAGTPTTLAAIALELSDYEGQKINGFKLHISQILEIFGELIILTKEEIKSKFNINPMRADVIVAGSLILINILNRICSDHCFASTKGLRYGLIKEIMFK